MAKTNAERQKIYRANRRYLGEGNNGEYNINMWISTGAKIALNRLSIRHGVSGKEILERLIKAEDSKISQSLDDKEKNEYRQSAAIYTKQGKKGLASRALLSNEN